MAHQLHPHRRCRASSEYSPPGPSPQPMMALLLLMRFSRMHSPMCLSSHSAWHDSGVVHARGGSPRSQNAGVASAPSIALAPTPYAMYVRLDLSAFALAARAAVLAGTTSCPRARTCR
eukprot:985785-Pyramimonas_sp.AAC.1